MFRAESSQPSKRPKGPQRMGDLLPQLMARRGYARFLSHDEFQEAWEAVSGSLHKQSRVGQLRGSVLEIIVSNSVVLHELTFQKRKLLKQLAEQLPDKKISDLRLKVGNIE